EPRDLVIGGQAPKMLAVARFAAARIGIVGAGDRPLRIGDRDSNSLRSIVDARDSPQPSVHGAIYPLGEDGPASLGASLASRLARTAAGAIGRRSSSETK